MFGVWFRMVRRVEVGWVFFFMWLFCMVSLGFFIGQFQGIQIYYIVVCFLLRKYFKRLGQKMLCFFWFIFRNFVVLFLLLISKLYGQFKLNIFSCYLLGVIFEYVFNKMKGVQKVWSIYFVLQRLRYQGGDFDQRFYYKMG